MNNKNIDKTKLDESLLLLNEQLLLLDAPLTELVVCGGSALIATLLVARTTNDVDIIAFMSGHDLKDSDPLPDYLLQAAQNVARSMGLPNDWLNNGPASQFNMGLPEGFKDRLHTSVIGAKLAVHYIGRYDQIFFKTYASVDRGGYHVTDLMALAPSEDELIKAAQWCMTQDVSYGFREILKDMFKQLGWGNVSERI